MCDESTEAENETFLQHLQLTRREMGVGAGATLAVMLTGCKSQPASGKEPDRAREPLKAEPAVEKAAIPGTTGRMVTIETPDGTAEAFFVTPKEGQHPGVLMWPDVAGLRDAFKTMATRLAGEGYAVLVVNQYYRSAKLPVLETFAEWQTEEGKKKVSPMRAAITPEHVTMDGAAFCAWLDRQEGVAQNKKLASCGYCMTGPYTIRTAAAAPERVGAIASFHGGGLVTAEPSSPHLLFPKIKAAALFCIAQNDDQREPETKKTLRQAADAARVPAEIEVYPAQHGWCTIDGPVYNQEQAERAWARMLATFERYL